MLPCYCFRLWCAVESYKGRVCSSCPQQLVQVPGNQLVCGLWEELRQLQVGTLRYNTVQHSTVQYSTGSYRWAQFRQGEVALQIIL